MRSDWFNANQDRWWPLRSVLLASWFLVQVAPQAWFPRSRDRLVKVWQPSLWIKSTNRSDVRRWTDHPKTLAKVWLKEEKDCWRYRVTEFRGLCVLMWARCSSVTVLVSAGSRGRSNRHRHQTCGGYVLLCRETHTAAANTQFGGEGKRREQRDFAWWRQTKCYHECWTQLYPVCPYVFCKYMQIGANLQQIWTLSFRIVMFTSYILTTFTCRVSIWRKTETCSLQQSAVHYCEWWWNSTPRLISLTFLSEKCKKTQNCKCRLWSCRGSEQLLSFSVGAKKEGAAGFFKGIGKGLVGVVARPTGGIVDMASSTFQGIQRYLLQAFVRVQFLFSLFSLSVTLFIRTLSPVFCRLKNFLCFLCAS